MSAHVRPTSKSLQWQKLAAARNRKPTKQQWESWRVKVEGMEAGPLRSAVAAIIFWDWLPDNEKLTPMWDAMIYEDGRDHVTKVEVVNALVSLGYRPDIAEYRVMPDDFYYEASPEEKAQRSRVRGSCLAGFLRG